MVMEAYTSLFCRLPCRSPRITDTRVPALYDAVAPSHCRCGFSLSQDGMKRPTMTTRALRSSPKNSDTRPGAGATLDQPGTYHFQHQGIELPSASTHVSNVSSSRADMHGCCRSLARHSEQVAAHWNMQRNNRLAAQCASVNFLKDWTFAFCERVGTALRRTCFSFGPAHVRNVGVAVEDFGASGGSMFKKACFFDFFGAWVLACTNGRGSPILARGASRLAVLMESWLRFLPPVRPGGFN